MTTTGWHLPSDAEWTQLTDYLGGTAVAGGKLKATTLWNSPNTGATNSSGFTAFPGGYRDYDGSYFSIGINGYWWSSTEINTTSAWYRYMYYYYSDVLRNINSKTNGFSVRCLKD